MPAIRICEAILYTLEFKIDAVRQARSGQGVGVVTATVHLMLINGSMRSP
jgi:hypothetical protein